MRSDERASYSLIAAVVLRVAPVTWAGARAATAGSRLQRDGCVGRMAIAERNVQAPVLEREMTEYVALTIGDAEVEASCTCGQPRCGHAVAALLVLQKNCREAQSSADLHNNVMAALRDRIGDNARVKQEVRTQILSNTERLPLPAAVDMLALTLRQTVRYSPVEIQEMLSVTERLQKHVVQEPKNTRELTIKLLQSLGGRKVIAQPLPESLESAVIRLVPLAAGVYIDDLPSSDELAQLLDLVFEGGIQVAGHVAAGLDVAAVQRPTMAKILAEKAIAWAQQSRKQWREIAPLTGRDRLCTALVAALLVHCDLDLACDLARLWPPMRSGLVPLATALGEAARYRDLMLIVDAYDNQAELWLAALHAALAAAQAAGHREFVIELAETAFEIEPNEVFFAALARATPAQKWLKLRDHLVARALADRDPPWLVAALAREPDAAIALQSIVSLSLLRDVVARDALRELTEIDPVAAFRARCCRINGLLDLSGATARSLRSELLLAQKISISLAEPGLFGDFSQVLLRERHDQKALRTAMEGVLAL